MLSLLDLLRRIDIGSLTPEGALRLCEEAIVAREGEIQAFAHRPAAVEAAPSGPLRGIGVGYKDTIDTADLPTELGSPIYAGWRPRADAAIVSLARAAGATTMGKTATTPFAFIDPAPTRNPRNPAHTPGGSSSGSAAAVAAGMLPLAFGSQTGGSVIRPASFCGVVGVKTSYRLLPMVGVKAYAWTLDTLGLFTATVADAAFALAAITGRDELRLPETGSGPPRIGVVTQDFTTPPDPSMAEALEAAARLAERAGATVRRVGLPSLCAEAFRAHQPLQDYEARQALAWEHRHHAEALPPLLRRALDAAQGIPAEAYDDARRSAHRARAALKDAFQDLDILITYAAPGPAPAGLSSTGDARFNRFWTLMGTPCVNVPALADSTGLPLGIQVVAPFGRDAQALRGAAFLEAALNGVAGSKFRV